MLSQSLTFAVAGAMLVFNWRLTLFILLAPVVGASGVIFGARLRKHSTTVRSTG